MTRLRKLMLEEPQRRNFSSETIRGYLGTVERFAKYFDKRPDRLGPERIRQWQAYPLHERKLAVGTVVNYVAGLRFFFRRVLKRRLPVDSTPYPLTQVHASPHASRIEPGRGCSPDRGGRHAAAACHADGPLLHRDAAYRTGSVASRRYRQRAHGHPCS
jgi:hypothetical protein